MILYNHIYFTLQLLLDLKHNTISIQRIAAAYNAILTEIMMNVDEFDVFVVFVNDSKIWEKNTRIISLFNR